MVSWVYEGKLGLWQTLKNWIVNISYTQCKKNMDLLRTYFRPTSISPRERKSTTDPASPSMNVSAVIPAPLTNYHPHANKQIIWSDTNPHNTPYLNNDDRAEWNNIQREEDQSKLERSRCDRNSRKRHLPRVLFTADEMAALCCGGFGASKWGVYYGVFAVSYIGFGAAGSLFFMSYLLLKSALRWFIRVYICIFI